MSSPVKISREFNRIAELVKKHVKQQRPKGLSLRNSRTLPRMLNIGHEL
jgi:hypothetical protein